MLGSPQAFGVLLYGGKDRGLFFVCLVRRTQPTHEANHHHAAAQKYFDFVEGRVGEELQGVRVETREKGISSESSRKKNRKGVAFQEVGAHEFLPGNQEFH